MVEEDERLDLSRPFDLLAFREDALGLVSGECLENLRASSDHTIQRDVSDASTFTFRTFVSTVSAARSVHATRLHGAILVYLLDKPVTLYDLAYFKNRAVYQFSFADACAIRFREPC